MDRPNGYFDIRAEHVNCDIINPFIEHGNPSSAVNTTVNGSILDSGRLNIKKRKFAECNDENVEEKNCEPTPKVTIVTVYD